MDTRFLESFVQVIELGSIAAAARLLDLTPTAVSLRLKALEAEVGTALIEPSLMRHSLPEPVPTRSLGLLWLRANTREKLVHAFLELAMP